MKLYMLKERENMPDTKFNPDEFITKISEKLVNHKMPACPCCGGEHFTTTENYIAHIASNDLANVNMNVHVPAGMIICENCGHIEFFALGALGLLNKKEGESNDK